MLIAVACLYGAHLLSEPLKLVTESGSLILEGVARLLNETQQFTFEILRDTKSEMGSLYQGIEVTHYQSRAGAWCTHETALITEFVVDSFTSAYPNSPGEVHNLLRAAVSDLARGSK